MSRIPGARPKRRRKWIHPELQRYLLGAFLALSALSLLVQYLLFVDVMSKVSMELPHDAPLMVELFAGSLLRVLLISFGVLLPLSAAVGVLVTFRVAGPVYRLERFLEEVRDGKRPADVRLRRGDKLAGFAQRLNEATAPLRAREGEAVGEEPRAAA